MTHNLQYNTGELFLHCSTARSVTALELTKAGPGKQKRNANDVPTPTPDHTSELSTGTPQKRARASTRDAIARAKHIPAQTNRSQGNLLFPQSLFDSSCCSNTVPGRSRNSLLRTGASKVRNSRMEGVVGYCITTSCRCTCMFMPNTH